MTVSPFGRILAGEKSLLEESYAAFSAQPEDCSFPPSPGGYPRRKEQTIANPVTITGPGTFLGKATRTITLRPTTLSGWWFNRTDLDESLATEASIRNVWTTGDVVSNIVLRSGSPHNYLRMVEHLAALKIGLDVDNVMIDIDSGDPPIFERGSLDVVEAFERAGRAECESPVRLLTVKERVSIVDSRGCFLIIDPADSESPQLILDCAIDFPNAIGKQRLVVPLLEEHFRTGCIARTNTSSGKKLYCQTIGRIFADIRNLGYNSENVLVAGKRKYINEPRLLHNGKSLEAVWHRAVLDLAAALALIDKGRFVGRVQSYKAGHTLDVRMATLLYLNDLLIEV